MRILLIPALCLPLLTTGCFVGDGVAHVVKLAQKKGKSSDDSSSQPAAAQPAPVQPAPASTGPVDRDPAPMPQTAPAATGIQSEDLPPPRK